MILRIALLTLLVLTSSQVQAEDNPELRSRWTLNRGITGSEIVIDRPEGARFVLTYPEFCVVETARETIVMKDGAKCRAYFFPDKLKVDPFTRGTKLIYSKHCFSVSSKTDRNFPKVSAQAVDELEVEAPVLTVRVVENVDPVQVPIYLSVLQIPSNDSRSANNVRAQLHKYPSIYYPTEGFYAVGNLSVTETKLKAKDHAIKMPSAGHLVIVP